MSERKKLTDILGAGQQDDLAAAWENTTAAGEFSPLRTGEYACRVLSGELFTSKGKETPGYKIALEVIEGEHAKRRLWYDVWLTPAALPMAKRDFAKLGIDTQERFRLLLRAELPLPQGILARVKVVLRTDGTGAAYNQVRSFEVTGIEPPDAFAPVASPPETPDHDAGESVALEPPTATHPKGSPNGRKMTAASPGANGPYGGDRR